MSGNWAPPSTPPGQPAKSPMPWWGWPLIVVVGIAVVGAFAWNQAKKNDDKQARSSSAYRITNRVCADDGLELTFTNLDDATHNYRLSALGKSSGGSVLVRDSEIVFDLRPGASTSVEFVWFDEAVTVCAMETVEVDPS